MRTFVYTLMTLSVVAIVTVLMLIILGYSFNRQDGKLEQGGLLQFASTPSGATVTLDGVQTGSRTPSKSSVEAKSHHVSMNLKGYRTWQKTIAVEAGGIGWLSYARLVPTDIKSDSMRTFPKLAASLASEDRKWIVAQQDAAVNAFTLINLESDTPKFTEIAFPEVTMSVPETAAPQSFTVVSWSKNDDRLLVKRTFDTTKTEWLVLDRQDPEKSINLTASFAIDPVDVTFRERNGSDAYVLTAEGIVRRIDFGSGTLSGPLVENVEEISVFDDQTLLYVTRADSKEPNQRHVGYRTGGMNKPQTIFSYPAETANLHVALGEYYGKTYVGVTHDMTMQVFVGDLPQDSRKGTLKQLMKTTLAEAPERLTIGENGRLAVAETAGGYTTYDIELLKTDTTQFTRPEAVNRPLQWLDGYLIANDRGGVLRLFEFDGANQQDVLPVIEGQAMSLTGNEKFLYGFTQGENGVSLTRVRMTVSN